MIDSFPDSNQRCQSACSTTAPVSDSCTWSHLAAVCRQQEMKGKASLSAHLLDGANCVGMRIGSACTRALVDTGADRCCMSETYFNQLRARGACLSVKPSHAVVRFAGGNVVDVLCDVETEITMGDKSYKTIFHVIPGLHHTAVIGRDFLKRYGMTIAYEPDDEENLPLDFNVRAIADIRLPAHTEVLYSQQVDYDALPEGVLLDYAGCRLTGQPEIWTARCQSKVNKGTFPVRFVNISDHEVMVSKGMSLGTVRRLTRSEVGRLSSVSSSIYQAPVGEAVEKNRDAFLPEVDYSRSQLSVEREKMDALLTEYSGSFVGPDGALGCTDLIEHDITVIPGAKPVQQMPFRLSPTMRENMQKVVQEQIDLGIVEPTYDGSWGSPAFLVRKSSGGYRRVCDYRNLNQVTEPQYLAIPRMDDALDAVGQIQPNYISALDLMMAFHQLPISEKSQDFTSFLTPFGKFRYQRLSMGLKNAARSCQMVVDLVLQGLLFKNCICYIDDVLVFSRTFDQHLLDLGEVLGRIRSAGLTLRASKCVVAASEVPFLGHILNKEGIKPDPSKVKAINAILPPKTQTQLRRFLGMTGFYRKFIPNYAASAQPLYALTKKGVAWEWKGEHQEAFQHLKAALTSDTLLIHPDFSRDFVVTTDASNDGLGATLSQAGTDGDLRPVAYAAKLFNRAQRNYSTLDRELYAIVYACLYWRVYLEGKPFLIRTDHAPLQYILNPRTKLTPRQIRWAADLRQFEFRVEHVKGKENVVPDALSRLEGEPYQKDKVDEMMESFPALCSIQVSEIQTSEPAHIVRLPKRQRRQIRLLKRLSSTTKRVRFDLTPRVFYFLPDVPISDSGANPTDDMSAINSAGQHQATLPSSHKRRKYGPQLAQQEATSQTTFPSWANVGPTSAPTWAQHGLPTLGHRDFAHGSHGGPTVAAHVQPP